MADNPKKKKLDSKRIALGQKHERNYLIKRAKQLIKLCELDIKNDVRRTKSYVCFAAEGYLEDKMSTKTIKRLAKAILLCLKRYK